MKKYFFILISVTLILSFLSDPVFGQQSSLSTKGNLKVLVLEGTPYERGLQHASALKKEIHELVKLWKADLQKTYKTGADVFIKIFLPSTTDSKPSSTLKIRHKAWKPFSSLSRVFRGQWTQQSFSGSGRQCCPAAGEFKRWSSCCLCDQGDLAAQDLY